MTALLARSPLSPNTTLFRSYVVGLGSCDRHCRIAVVGSCNGSCSGDGRTLSSNVGRYSEESRRHLIGNGHRLARTFYSAAVLRNCPGMCNRTPALNYVVGLG